MSRVSLTRRLAAVLEAAERIDPLVARVYRLPPALRLRYDAWRAECDAIYARLEREGGPAAIYAAMIEGELVTPDPPRAVAVALGLNGGPTLLDTMSVQEAADLWARMVEA